jgi:hypothetical protein
MFNGMPNLQLNQMVLAAAGSMFKGSEKQKERAKAEEKEKEMEFVVYQHEKQDEMHKPTNSGRLA